MYYIEKCKGAYIRSRAAWIEKGEKKPHGTFKIQKKKHQSNNNINQIRDKNKTVHTHSDNIMKCLYWFCNSLQRNASKHIPGNDIDPYLSDIHCEMFTIGEQENCDKTPLIEECNKALRSIKDNKSP